MLAFGFYMWYKVGIMAKIDNKTNFNTLARSIFADINGANSGKQTPPGKPNSPPGGVSVFGGIK